MTEHFDDAPVADAEPVVRVSAFGKDAVPVPLVADKTASYYIGQAGFRATRRHSLSFNGETVTAKTVIGAPGALIIANKSSNG